MSSAPRYASRTVAPNLVRERRLIEAGGTLLSPRKADLILRGEGGLYIKELISGDEGRTVPSLTGRLGVVSRVVELDVIDVTSNAFPDSQEELA